MIELCVNIVYSTVYTYMGVGVWAASSASATVTSQVKFTSTGIAGTVSVVDYAGAGLSSAATYSFGLASDGAVTHTSGTAGSDYAKDFDGNEAVGNYYITPNYTAAATAQTWKLKIADVAFSGDGSATTASKTVKFQFTTASDLDRAVTLTLGTTVGSTTLSTTETVVATTDTTNWAIGTAITDSGTTTAAKAKESTGVITAKVSASTSDATAAGGTGAEITVTYNYYGTSAKGMTASSITYALSLAQKASQ